MFLQFIPFAVLVAGAIIYVAPGNSNFRELARDMFWTGLLVCLLQVSGLLR